MVTKDLQLFNLLNKLSQKKFKDFEKYYENDSKPFINKIDRDNKKSNIFPSYILKQIKKIDKNNYDSAVCILRGALPYSILFEAEGWKVHYIICGRKNQKIAKTMDDLRFNKSIDKTISKIRNKKVLFIENNSLTGNTSYKVLLELKEKLKIKKPDLFLDYFVPGLKWAKEVVQFKHNKKRLNSFGKIFIAKRTKITKKESEILNKEFIAKLRKMNL